MSYVLAGFKMILVLVKFPFVWVFRLLGWLVRLLFKVTGVVSWQPPRWGGRVKSFVSSHRKQCLQFLMVSGAVLVISVAGWLFYESRPKPLLFDVYVNAPMETAYSVDELKPNPVKVKFSLPPVYWNASTSGVAPVDKIGKAVKEGIRLTPKHEGQWFWTADDSLEFRPNRNWPVGTEYQIEIDEKLLRKGVRLADYHVSFRTVSLKASLQKFELYRDPTKKSVHQVVGTLRFNFPVDLASVQDALTLSRYSNRSLSGVGSDRYSFTVTHDKHLREIYFTSEEISIGQKENYVKLHVKGVKALSSSATLARVIERSVLIPSVSTYFRVKQVNTRIVKDLDDVPQQTLMVELTDDIAADKISQHVEAYLLPARKSWNRPREIKNSVLQKSERVALKKVESETDAGMLHSFVFDVPSRSEKYWRARQLYVKVTPGLASENDFVLSKPYDTVLNVPNYPKEIAFVGDGAVLSFKGEQQLSLRSRGFASLKVSVARVQANQVHHFVSQSYGDINHPYFQGAFSPQNLSVVEEKTIPLAVSHPKNAVYASVDMKEFMTPSSIGMGLFSVKVTGVNAQGQDDYGAEATRTFLVTDLGLLLKRHVDKSRDLFVMSVSEGQPVQGAKVSLLGRNGLPLLDAQVTASDGLVRFPDVSHFKNEKYPTVYVVERGEDISFIPYKRDERALNYSLFDVGGVRSHSVRANQLSAYMFSDRGIYRPGEQVRLAAIVKRQDFRATDGVPLVVKVFNPSGSEVYKKPVQLNAHGFLDFDYQTDVTSLTGQYQAYVYLVEKRNYHRQLGYVQFSVEEFQPDKLRIRSQLVQTPVRGWLNDLKLAPEVTLQNLFGTAAQNRKVKANYVLRPRGFHFSKWSDYQFVDPYFDKDISLTSISEVLPEQVTNDDGRAVFDMDLSQYQAGLYELNFDVEGFEADGGRSVRTVNRVLVSPAEYLVGFKSDAQLGYLPLESEAAVDFVAISPQLDARAVDGLKIRHVESYYVSVLVKQRDGTYQYQSVRKEKVLSEKSFSLTKAVTPFALPTQQPGEFRIDLVNTEGRVVSRVPFSVIGTGNVTAALEKNAELSVKLNQASYRNGDEIEVSVTAPYTGAGLITIERDKVYRYKWFQTTQNQFVERIKVPEGLEGNAYVNVTFVRALDSKEVFTSPLSFAAVPFAIDRSRREIDVSLSVPGKVLPGETLNVNYQTDKASSLLLFGVDEGILQVAGFKTPEPLGHFLRKRALEVETMQILDLVLPEYSVLREKLGIGGGFAEADEALMQELKAKNLNPFQRKVDKPVVFWSGLLNSSGEKGVYSFKVPDRFDGAMKIMAVAVNEDAIGVEDVKTIVRGPFVITPSVLTTVAPGDSFDVVAQVSNQLEGSGADAKVSISLESTEHLTVDLPVTQELVIGEGQEKSARFRVKANKKLGAAELKFVAQIGQKLRARTVSLSVRPAVPFQTTVSSGSQESGLQKLPVGRKLLIDLSENNLSFSTDPLVLIDGLMSYLKNFAHQCTEQLVSKIFPLLLDVNDREGSQAKRLSSYQSLVTTLRARQTAEGGFSIWPRARSSAIYPSIYVLHFLTEAKDQGLPVPEMMLGRGLDYLQKYVGKSSQGLFESRMRAYAIYVLTRHGEVTSNYLMHLEESLDKTFKETWREDILAVYMAASYQLLQKPENAEQLLEKYKLGAAEGEAFSDYDSRLAHDGQMIYLMAKHFPKQVRALDREQLLRMARPIMAGEFNTFSSSFASLALMAYSQETGSALKAEVMADNGHTQSPVTVVKRRFYEADFHVDAQHLTVDSDKPYFYVVAQSGFDVDVPKKAVSSGLDVAKSFLTKDGKPIIRFVQGEEITLELRVRSLKNRTLTNVAVVDLLPAGFEVVRQSVREQSQGMDYIDIREDRVVFYGSFGSNMKTLKYRVKLTAAGDFQVPPVFAEAMYDRSVYAVSEGQRVEVYVK